MKKVVLITICLVTLALGIAIGTASATYVVDPDAFPAGTVLNNAYPGVTLSSHGEVVTPNVYSLGSPLASTGDRVFTSDSGTDWGNGVFEYLRADFAGGATDVWLDFISNDSNGDHNAELLAYDINGNLVANQFVYFVPAFEAATLHVSAPEIAWIAAYWDEKTRIENGQLDNLQYDTVPEPGSLMALGSGGLMGLLGFIRRKR